jgi:hypothetical protein
MQNPLDKLLEKQGLKYEDLNYSERETYHSTNFNVDAINSGKLKEHVTEMKNSIAMQLTDVDPIQEPHKDLQLKARLKNYIMLEAFLLAPEKAQKAVEDSLKNIK